MFLGVVDLSARLRTLGAVVILVVGEVGWEQGAHRGGEGAGRQAEKHQDSQEGTHVELD